jgi:hypothetical protein
MWIRVACCALWLAALGAGQACAADWYTGRPGGSSRAAASAGPAGQGQETSEDNWIVAVDASLTATSTNSVFGNLVGTFAAMGTLKQSGLRLRVDALAGSYDYQATGPARTIHSTQQAGSALIGYEWVARNTTAAIYVGAAAQDVSLSAPDPLNSVVGASVGVKISGEFYTRPTPVTMASGYASWSSMHNAYYTRLKYGWAVLDDTFMGPEISFLGDDLYSQIRLGVHLTGFRVAALQFGISGGYVRDFKTGSGGYGILDARLGF